MRRALFLTLSLIAVFALGATLGHIIDQKTHSKKTQSASFALKNRPFTIVVIGVNNGASIEKTFSSVFSQNYDAFRLIYIDDASDDGSFDLARETLYSFEKPIEIDLVQNEKRLGILANLFRAVQSCSDEEIVVVLHGEDFLAHEWVLQRLNAYYENPNVWVACAQSIEFPSFQKGPVLDCIDSSIRYKLYQGTFLKSFYASLFKKIRDSDFIHSGDFLPASAEFAYMTPMLEMGGEHFCFIPEVLYIHNQNGIYREDPELQRLSERWVKTLDPYQKLVSLCGD